MKEEIIEDNDLSGELSTIEKLTMQNRQASIADFDQIELSNDTANAEMVLDQELISAAESTTLLEYEQGHLNPVYKKLFFDPMSPDEIMQWQGKLITKPLLRLPSSLVFEQSKKRIHRIGQKNKCTYYIFMCENSVEQKIYSTLQERKDYTDKLFEKDFM